MLPKTFTLRAPMDSAAVQLESFLSLVSNRALQSASGTYSGTGKAITITTPFYPKIIITSPMIVVATATTTTTGYMTVSLASNIGMTYIPGIGFVKDCITAATNTGFSIGVNSVVNAAPTAVTTTVYTYFAIG